MYNNEGRNTFVRDTVIKILLVLLFVFLLIWLFPMPNLNPFYDRIFADNVKSMKEVAKSYYTIERLPKNVGDKDKLTLQDMLDKKMIIPFIDKDGKSCDPINSYVEVVKMDTEYLFKTSLSCNGKSDYVVDYFGCYDICKDNNCGTPTTCQKDVKEYEFKKTTNSSYVDHYVCPAGYILNGKSCVKTVENTDTKPAEITCKSGYTYNSTNKKCEKTVTDEVNANMSCPTGFVYNSTSKKCLKTTGETRNADPSCVAYPGYEYNSTTKKCEKPITVYEDGTPTCSAYPGYEYNSATKKCEKSTPEQINATPNCASGYNYNSGNGLCEKLTPEQINGTPNCASGYNYNSGKGLCEKSTPEQINGTPNCASGYNYKSGSGLCEKSNSTAMCDSGYTYSSGKCTITQAWNKTYSGWSCQYKWYSVDKPKVTQELFTRSDLIAIQTGKPGCSGSDCYILWYEYKECNQSRTCPSGFTYSASASTCTKTGTVRTSCSGGTISGSTCITIDKQNPTYSCPSGYTQNGSVCNRTTYSSTPATYTCPSGYTQNGSKCNRTIFEQRTPNYYCPSGYTQSGSTCYKTITSQKTPNYYCPSGYTQNGTICSRTTNEERDPSYNCATGTPKQGDKTKCIVSSVDRIDYSYGCPTSYILNGSACYKTSKSDDTKDAEAIYKNGATTKYTWSKNNVLAGWTATGKTRTTKVPCDK